MTIIRTSIRWMVVVFLTSMLIIVPVAAGSTAKTDSSDTTYDAFFLDDGIYGTKDVDVKIDNAGGQHAAFAEWNGDGVFYGYCTSDCGHAENWSFTEIFNSGVSFGYTPFQVQLQIDPNDRPRVVFEVDGYNLSSNGYFYAECNTTCTSGLNWQVGKFAEGGRTVIGDSHWFVLDQQGRPRTVTTYAEANYLQDQLVYLYYNACNTDCTDPSNWYLTQVLELGNLGLTPIVVASLELTSDGYPRLGLNALWNNNNSPYYAECNTVCEQATNWKWVFAPASWSTSFDLTLDSQDHVHIATPAVDGVGYITCNGDCTDTENWSSFTIGGLPAGSGVGVGLTFDSQDRPHMAYTVDPAVGSNSLAYLLCMSDCESQQTSEWKVETIEEARAFPDKPLNPRCAEQGWSLNGPLSLALDNEDNPILGYEASNIQIYCSSPGPPVFVAFRFGRIGSMNIEVKPDGAGVLIDPTTLTLSEGGSTDTYTVVLTSQPTAAVTVSIAPDEQVSTDATTLTFTPNTWDTAQTVTVSALDDSVEEGMHSGTITHSATSSGEDYNGISIVKVTATVQDNDGRASSDAPIIYLPLIVK